ncbi:integrase [Sedimentibacter acidaminivorans]|jgi:integrase|uniref:Integrase n=1 Tax=Sedimentibacter acidaminivorans TaxID=913099 RepID=A0ABS4GAC4_9FIRM|nr:site-specific integrase [Sedimentibacter acidaminivorans]MBP1924638.1 integrase [Sedimentibacter acidaminivorans]
MAKQKKRSDGRYCKNVTIGRNTNGTLKRKMIYANTQKELDLKVAELTLQVDKGVIIDDKGMTVYKWSIDWLKVYKGDLDDNTQHNYQCTINKYIQPNFEHIKLKELKQAQVKAVLNQIKYVTASKMFLSTMIQMLDKAVENDYVSKNVAIGLTSKKYYKKSKEPLTNEQINIIKNTPHEIQKLCLMLIYSGLRIDELINLTWSNVDMKKKYLSVIEDDEKNVKTEAGIRNIPIVQPLLDILKELDTKNIKTIDSSKDYIFKYKSTKYTMRRLSYLRYKYCDICDFDFTYHQCRHTYASMLYYAGVRVKEAQEWLGHASSSMTMDIYTHLQEKDKLTSANKIDEYLKTI